MASPGSITGRTLGHYHIVEQIGAGGMGVVYRAHDERLERDVALKILPPGTLADESARKRFRKEALALSRLNHPNIATVHDFDTQEGIDFLVTELVPGVTLDEKLVSGPLPEKQIIQIGLQMAEGLEAAHREGVIHRDLKPGNLRLTPEGRLKILDFGLAKRVGPADQATVTESMSEPGGAAGTLAYMAPEQLKGDKVDARADLWAAGVVLYELATRQRPFTGKTSTALTDEILHAPLASPQSLQPRLSARMTDIILKCLEKDPENRYQSAKELLVDLRRLSTPTATAVVATPRPAEAAKVLRVAGAAAAVLIVAAVGYWYLARGKPRAADTPQIRSLAVLPLANLSGDPSQEYFADGMTESLITELSHIGALKVISRTSVMQYKTAKKPLPEIARELGVDGIIEGSVIREGGQAKITVQLIHAPTDTHLWAQDYVREMRGILALQSEVARAVAGQVKAALTPAETAQFASSKAVNPEAYDLYLRGKVLFDRPENWRSAIELFQQATTKDPNYASAYGALAYGSIIAHNQGQLPRSEAFPRAQQAAQKAAELDPEDLDVMKAQVAVNFTILRDYQVAERIMQRILKRTPNDGETHAWLGATFSLYGRFDESIAEARRAVGLDPQSVSRNSYLAAIYRKARRFDECVGQARKTVELGPNSFWGYFVLADCYDAKGMHDDAARALQRAWLLYGEDPGAAARLVTAQAHGGYRARLLAELAHALKMLGRSNLSFGDIASYYALLGDKEEAFRYLERAYQEYDSTIFDIQSSDFDSLRDDPRWPAFLRRLNLQDTPMAKLPAAPAPAAR